MKALQKREEELAQAESYSNVQKVIEAQVEQTLPGLMGPQKKKKDDTDAKPPFMQMFRRLLQRRSSDDDDRGQPSSSRSYDRDHRRGRSDSREKRGRRRSDSRSRSRAPRRKGDNRHLSSRPISHQTSEQPPRRTLTPLSKESTIEGANDKELCKGILKGV